MKKLFFLLLIMLPALATAQGHKGEVDECAPMKNGKVCYRDTVHVKDRFFVTFGAVHVLKLVSLLQSKVMPALLNICLLIALVLLTVPSKTPLFR